MYHNVVVIKVNKNRFFLTLHCLLFLSQISSRWRRPSFSITKHLPGSRKAQLRPSGRSLSGRDPYYTSPHIDMCHIICIYVAICNWLSTSSCSMGLKTPPDTTYLKFSAQGSYHFFLLSQAQTLETVCVDNYKYSIYCFSQLLTILWNDFECTLNNRNQAFVLRG